MRIIKYPPYPHNNLAVGLFVCRLEITLRVNFSWFKFNVLGYLGVALAAKKLGIEKNCYVVMPKFAPDIKVDSVRRMGVNIILHGSDFDEAKQVYLLFLY